MITLQLDKAEPVGEGNHQRHHQGQRIAATGLTQKPEMVRRASRYWLPFGKQVAIIGADLVGLELAEFLAERGRIVHVIDDKPRIGAGLPIVRRVGVLVDLQEKDVAIHRNASHIEIEEKQVVFTVEGKTRSVHADHVIVAKGATGNLELANQLESEGFKTFTVGDCNSVGYIDGAMSNAFETVRQIQQLT